MVFLSIFALIASWICAVCYAWHYFIWNLHSPTLTHKIISKKNKKILKIAIEKKHKLTGSSNVANHIVYISLYNAHSYTFDNGVIKKLWRLLDLNFVPPDPQSSLLIVTQLGIAQFFNLINIIFSLRVYFVNVSHVILFLFFSWYFS